MVVREEGAILPFSASPAGATSDEHEPHAAGRLADRHRASVADPLVSAQPPADRHAAAGARLSTGYSLAPRFITLKPTLRCNLRCEFCRFVANGDVFGKRDWLEIEDWERIIDEIAPFQPYICLTGGEPTMYPQIARLIARIKQRGLTCVMTTNGTMLEARAEELMESPPDVLILSIDGPREVHDQVRMVDGTFDRAMRGVRKLQRLQQERGQHSPYLIINSAITGRTYENTLEMIEVAKASARSPSISSTSGS